LHLLFFLSIPSAARNLLLALAQRAPVLPTAPSHHRSLTLHLAPKLALTLLLATAAIHAQTVPAAPPAPADTPHGEVLFESHGDPPTTPEDSTARALTAAVPDLSDAARSAIAITAYDLDTRITPAVSLLTVRARITIRNASSEPLPRIALQLSSSLQWESITLLTPSPATRLPLAQHLLDTDADHTGKVSEAILTLPQPLAPGASITLDTLYSGPIIADATRLERIGATAAQGTDTDWDAIGTAESTSADSAPTSTTVTTALRGFGNVLWYPVSAPPLFLGDGAKLFQAVGAMRLAEASTTIHLRLAVEYHGDPPTVAYFCGRRQPLVAMPDDPNLPTSVGAGIATADFPTEPLGFRLPSLFLIERPETLIAPLPTPESTSAATPAPESTPSGPPILAVETDNDAPLPLLTASAQAIAPLLQQWLGTHPLTALTILDHPGEPFQDGPLLVAPVASLAAATSTPALVHSLTHAWVQTGQPWFDEGLPAFMGLLWTEQQQGREAAVAQLNDLLQPVTLAEPAFTPADNSATGQPLISATDDLFYRRKAAAVWWMLRSIVGDEPFIAALQQQLAQPIWRDSASQQAATFEHLLEKTSNKNLSWFFADWVLRDRGLPDLSIAAVEPRQLPAGAGHNSGWLVAVTIRNDGAAAAEVPLTVRSGTFNTTKRLRIPGFSTITDRVVVEDPPTQVMVNDGTTPEVRTSLHTQDVTIATTP
jgi:hypothetical protein